MTTGPRILLLEDSDLDWELAVAQLNMAALGGNVNRVATREEFALALSSGQKYDLILADYNLPGFDGHEALQAAQRHCPETPFVFLSGKLGEDHAIDMLRQGATDYVLKQRIDRLVPAVQRAISEAKERSDRVRAEAALRESEAKFRQLADSMPQIVWAARPDGYIDYYNERWYEYTGCERAVYGWASLRPVLHPDDAGRCEESYFRSIAERRPYQAELRLMDRGTSSYRWFLCRAVPIQGAASAGADRWFGTCTDIHEQKLTSEALLHSREQMEMIVKGANVGVWHCALPFTHLTWDEKVREHFHLGPGGDVTIEMFYNGLHPDDRERTRAAIDRSITERTPYDIEYRTLKPGNGAMTWVRAVGRAFYNDAGEPVRFDGITIDITERARVEDQVREQSRTMEIVNRIGRSVAAELDVSRLMQSVVDATTQLTDARFGAFLHDGPDREGKASRLSALAGPDRAAVQPGQWPAQLLRDAFPHVRAVRIDDATAGSECASLTPFTELLASFPRQRSYLAVPVLSRTGKVLGGLFYGHFRPGVFTEQHERIVEGVAAQVGVAMDNAWLFEAARRANAEKDVLLERERAARAEAERASQLKDEFLATLSHELRTPLSAILGWTHLMRRQGGADGRIGEGLATIERNARVQAQLVEELLDMSRIISGKVRLDVQRVSLGDVIDAACETVSPAAEAKQIRLRRVLDPLAGPVSGDPNRLQQIVWNLLINAVKFTPRGGRVDIALARVDSHIEIAVRDTGEGISPAFLPWVFDRFRQADGSTSRRHGGLGLGLAIVKHLVELHGGVVRAESPGPGMGSTFTVELPVSPIAHRRMETEMDAGPSSRHPASASPVPAINALPRLDGVRVLVVDDDPDARVLMEQLLVDCGAEVIMAVDAESAFESLRERRPALLVSDIGMPGQDGYELIRRVRSLPDSMGGRTPALALTAFARSDDRRRAIAAGYQAHLAKPAEPAELVTVLASLAGVLPSEPAGRQAPRVQG